MRPLRAAVRSTNLLLAIVLHLHYSSRVANHTNNFLITFRFTSIYGHLKGFLSSRENGNNLSKPNLSEFEKLCVH
ncbi:hypothetical protein EYC80_005420 [Monilinia laxa]|uniref:LAGLIDADG endonuclease n=1 Tax=Monilinia laxa TaxID=61186 RepID=A0A5N6KKG2_MONLA|nr:hypothetical protein EYC80_005420 [Monilinia laxa]